MSVVAGVQVSLGLQDQAFITGLNNSAAAIRNLANQVNQTAGAVNTGMGKIGTSTRAARGQMQNFAFQVQDVVVSLQMGMDPARVFTQQIGQMLQIFGPVGASLGVAATLLGAFAGSMLNAGSASKQAAKDLDEFDPALTENMTTVDEVIEHYRTLDAEMREMLGTRAAAQVNEVTTALEAQRAKIDEVIRGFGDVSGGLMPSPMALLGGPVLNFDLVSRRSRLGKSAI